MDISFFLRGLIVGFSIAAPVGPIGVLCILRTLAEGLGHSLVSDLGAATADAIYGFVARFGLGFISNFLVRQQVWLRIIGGGFLCFLGVRTFMSKPAEHVAQAKGNGLVDSYASTFFLTITNSVTIFSFGAIFAGLGVGGASGSYVSGVVLVLGVFIGSALWWFILSSSVSVFRTKLSPHSLRWVNRISDIIITGFGIFALLSLGGESRMRARKR